MRKDERNDATALLRHDWYSGGWHGDQSIADLLEETARERADIPVTFVTETGTRVATLAEIADQARRIASGLRKIGLDSGDAIVIQVPNSFESMVTTRAAFLLGLVVVPVIHIYGTTELAFIVNQTSAKAIVVPSQWHNVDFLERVSTLKRETSITNVIVIGEPASPTEISWRDLLVDGYEPTEVHADDIAAVIYTSGTTSGALKGVKHTNNSLLAVSRANPSHSVGLQQSRATAHTHPETEQFSPSPAGHIAGLLVSLRAMLTGVRTTLMDRWDTQAALRILQSQPEAHMNGAPYFFVALLDAENDACDSPRGPRTFQTGGASVSPALIERAQSTGRTGWRIYGSSEVPSLAFSSPEDPLAVRAYTDGRLAPGAEVRIIDETGNLCAAGETGEIVTRAPQMFVGYQDVGLDRDAFTKDGWFRTGDVGSLDDAGFLTVAGRIKDIIIRGGENISAKEVEDLLTRHPRIIEAAAIPVPDDKYGERVCAVVRPHPGAALTLEEIGEHFVANGVARQKTPEFLVEVSDWPRTESGKVKKRDLREIAIDALGLSNRPSTTP